MNEKESRVAYDVIKAATEGDIIAMGIILEEFAKDIEVEMSRRVSWLSAEDRKDCRQEVMIDLMRLIPKKFKA